jgi:putative alpha-1,2-mannosidase
LLAGHVFAGATLPFGKSFQTPHWIASLTKSGMAKAVADTKGENQAGFAFDTEVVTGFSHMHDDGTGGVGSLIHSNFSFANPLLVPVDGKFSYIRPGQLPA